LHIIIVILLLIDEIDLLHRSLILGRVDTELAD